MMSLLGTLIFIVVGLGIAAYIVKHFMENNTTAVDEKREAKKKKKKRRF